VKATDICYPCLQRLARQAAAMATDNESLRAEAERAGLQIIDDNFSPDLLTLEIATAIHKAVKEITGNPDPYRRMKDDEIRVARELSAEVASSYPQDFKGLMALSTAGNSIDFFRSIDDIKRDMRAPVRFVADDSDKFIGKLEGAKDILFLADNAGEVFFDLPLVEYLERYAPVTYVVKGEPVQNDMTLDDLRLAGLDGRLRRVITTGAATPGVIMAKASDQFRRAFEGAGLVLAKGMGYYEGLSELPPQGRVLHCTMAKCQPVADSIGVPLNSYLAVLR